MKTIWAIGAIAAAATLTTAALAGAQAMDGQGAAPPPMAGHGPMGGPMGGRAMRGGWGGGAMRLSPEERRKVLADRFAQMDANHDGRVSFEEFRAYLERKKLERQHEMFRRMTGGTDSLTLDQLDRMGREVGPNPGPGRGPMGRGGQTPPGE